MNTLIVYSTKYGCTEKCAKTLSEKLEGRVEMCNLKKNSTPNLAEFDKVIVGGSIYIGRIQKEVNKFCTKNLDVLKNKKTGFFICCMEDGEKAKAELNNVFPQELLNKAAAAEYLGGEFIFNKAKALDRFIVKKVAKVDKDVLKISEDNIKSFAEHMNMA